MTRPLTHQQASELMAALVLAQTGWNDATCEATTEQIMRRWTNYDAAVEAIRTVCDTWTGMGRPPWGILQEAYKTAARRQIMDTPQIEGRPSRIVSAREGREIAARSYAAECRRRPDDDPLILAGFRTNEPNGNFLDRIISTDRAVRTEPT